MKSRFLLAGSLLLLASMACSTANLVGLLVTPTAPQPRLLHPPTATVILAPTSTPITHTATFTLTPTPLGWSPSDTPTKTGTPAATGTFDATPTVEENILLLPEASGLQSVLLSRESIYFGSDCPFPAEVEIRARVVNPDRVGLVSFFLRLRNKDTGNDSGWDVGTTMTKSGNGLYALSLDANDLHADDRYTYYTSAWIEFQLVVFDGRIREIGRTEKLLERLSLEACP